MNSGTASRVRERPAFQRWTKKGPKRSVLREHAGAARMAAKAFSTRERPCQADPASLTSGTFLERRSLQNFDVVVIGAGAAGMMCAIEAGKRGRSRAGASTMPTSPARRSASPAAGAATSPTSTPAPANFISANPRLLPSRRCAATRQRDFIALVERHGIAYHEKTLGQLFCDGSARRSSTCCWPRCDAGGRANCACRPPSSASRNADGVRARRLSQGAVALRRRWWSPRGGKSIPKMGATGFGYDVARQFGLQSCRDAPGARAADLRAGHAGAAAPLWPASRWMRVASCGKTRLREAMLFTHRGLERSGDPADLVLLARGRRDRASTCCRAWTCSRACARPAPRMAGRRLQTALARICPSAWRSCIAEEQRRAGNLADYVRQGLRAVAEAVNGWRIKPAGSEGYRTAEVTLGGVDTRELDPRRPWRHGGAGPLLHRRGGGRHRLARRLQFPVGLVVRLVRRAGCLKANRLFPPPCGEG